MLEFFAKLKLNSIIDKNPTKKTKRFLCWNDISSMAIIIESNKNLNKNNLDNFIEKTGKYVEVFYVETNNKQATFGDWNCFTKKDLTLLNLPKSETILSLKTKQFDLVINTCNDSNLFAAALNNYLTSTFKCGLSNAYNDTDLIISKQESYDLPLYLTDISNYLKMIKYLFYK